MVKVRLKSDPEDWGGNGRVYFPGRHLGSAKRVMAEARKSIRQRADEEQECMRGKGGIPFLPTYMWQRGGVRHCREFRVFQGQSVWPILAPITTNYMAKSLNAYNQ